jgi:hypothetical protein
MDCSIMGARTTACQLPQSREKWILQRHPRFTTKEFAPTANKLQARPKRPIARR